MQVLYAPLYLGHDIAVVDLCDDSLCVGGGVLEVLHGLLRIIYGLLYALRKISIVEQGADGATALPDAVDDLLDVGSNPVG